MLTWSSQYTTGVPLVDSQHKVLFEQINRLEELVLMSPLPVEQIEKVLQFLDSYSVSHFQYEEQCMMRHSCPVHEENKKAHADFLAVLGDFKREIETQGPTEELLKRLHRYTSEWAAFHVMSVDVKLRAAVLQVSRQANQG